ncbi:sigma-70 family RNA polymerase sigma factor [Rhizobium lusitanum]|uniref:Sigma-70 family RNA polymerase sigma factor n=1 Tax=Rhizobium lusitanum TaxID=293958 RepID=A0A6L9U8W7_9HYPH|nr:sigma-70 family RNA polymerase sigma factor [Rhizobium lusitanum]NEI72395.1 sigma-70 family RNA polymerase sigma factor [Rhizobium lusitanum]
MTDYNDELLAIFSSHETQLRRYLRSKAESREDVDDLFQEAWIKLARNGAAAIAAPIPYLMRIARTLALDHGRAERRRLGKREVADLLAVADQQAGPEKITQDRDQLRCLMEIINELPARQRRMLTASRLQQRPHAEIAKEFDLSVRTVELEIRKACDYCRRRLDDKNRI